MEYERFLYYREFEKDTAYRCAGGADEWAVAWQTFRVLELPASNDQTGVELDDVDGGGVVFLTVNEAFTLGDKDFRIPGIGSYMAEAINQFDSKLEYVEADAGGGGGDDGDDRGGGSIVLAADCGLEQAAQDRGAAETNKPQSWFLNLLSKSRGAKWMGEAAGPRGSSCERRWGRVGRAAGAISPAGKARRWFGWWEVVVDCGGGGVCRCGGAWLGLRLLVRLPLP